MGMSATAHPTRDEATARTSVTVRALLERCFKVFTAGFTTWWPPAHHIGKCDFEAAIIEPRAGGRWYERGIDGTECEWGRVLAFEPPRRLLLSWHLNVSFQYDPDPTHASEIEIRFIEEGAKQTRVELEHRHLDRHGENWRQLVTGISSDEGWPGILRTFAAKTESDA
jgi:uncharacterized protein YndB with AHSA1/START domain